MAAIIIVYILGYIASLWIMYIMIPKGSEVAFRHILTMLLASILSWATAIFLLIQKYNDKVIFTKK